MAAFTMTCPSCQTALRVAQPPGSGGVIRCPHCEGLFRLWGAEETWRAPPPFRQDAPEPSREGSSVFRMGRSLSPQPEPEPVQPGRRTPGAAPRPRPRRRLRTLPPEHRLPPANQFLLVACGVMLVVALLGLGLIVLFANTMLPPETIPAR
jgi:predicted Zn finger-like uncharacterized protein